MTRIGSRWLLATTLGSLVLASSGCSLIFVKPPGGRSGHQGRDDCTTSKVAPVLDTIFTGLEVARVAYAAAAPEKVYRDANTPISREADIALGVGFTALFLGSAIYGYTNTSKCSKRTGEPHRSFERSEPVEKWTEPAAPVRPPTAPPVRQPAAPAPSASQPKAPSQPFPAPSTLPVEEAPNGDLPGAPPTTTDDAEVHAPSTP